MITYLLLGIFAGIIAGLLGVGGGILIVPVLAGIFLAQQFPTEIIMQMAVASSLATIVVTSISSVRAHHARGGVRWNLVLQLAGGIVVGAWLGSAIAHLMPSKGMAWFFGIFELFVAAQMLLGKQPAPHRQEPEKGSNLIAGTGIGTLSSILGIGGGTLTVPYLVWHNVPMRTAVGTAAACGLPIAAAGTLGFIVSGWNVPNLPDGATGYVYWPAVATICVTSMLAAPLGAKLAYKLPQQKLKKAFGLVLACFGVYMLVKF